MVQWLGLHALTAGGPEFNPWSTNKQKAEENAEGGESALGPDGEVRDFASIFTVLC